MEGNPDSLAVTQESRREHTVFFLILVQTPSLIGMLSVCKHFMENFRTCLRVGLHAGKPCVVKSLLIYNYSMVWLVVQTSNFPVVSTWIVCIEIMYFLRKTKKVSSPETLVRKTPRAFSMLSLLSKQRNLS